MYVVYNNHLCCFITLCNPVKTLAVNSWHKTFLGLHIYAGSKFFVKKNKIKEKKTQNQTNQPNIKKPRTNSLFSPPCMWCWYRWLSFCTYCFPSLSAVAGVISKAFKAKYYHLMPCSHYSAFCLLKNKPFTSFLSQGILSHVIKEQVIPMPRRLLSLRSCWWILFLLEMSGVPALAALQKSMFAPHWALGRMSMIKCDSPVL